MGRNCRHKISASGMEVNFDTVNNSFEFKSGSTGEALAANSAKGLQLTKVCLTWPLGVMD